MSWQSRNLLVHFMQSSSRQHEYKVNSAISGFLSGACSQMVLHPIDSMKTRLQGFSHCELSNFTHLTQHKEEEKELMLAFVQHTLDSDTFFPQVMGGVVCIKEWVQPQLVVLSHGVYISLFTTHPRRHMQSTCKVKILHKQRKTFLHNIYSFQEWRLVSSLRSAHIPFGLLKYECNCKRR